MCARGPPVTTSPFFSLKVSGCSATFHPSIDLPSKMTLNPSSFSSAALLILAVTASAIASPSKINPPRIILFPFNCEDTLRHELVNSYQKPPPRTIHRQQRPSPSPFFLRLADYENMQFVESPPEPSPRL